MLREEDVLRSGREVATCDEDKEGEKERNLHEWFALRVRAKEPNTLSSRFFFIHLYINIIY